MQIDAWMRLGVEVLMCVIVSLRVGVVVDVRVSWQVLMDNGVAEAGM